MLYPGSLASSTPLDEEQRSYTNYPRTKDTTPTVIDQVHRVVTPYLASSNFRLLNKVGMGMMLQQILPFSPVALLIFREAGLVDLSDQTIMCLLAGAFLQWMMPRSSFLLLAGIACYQIGKSQGFFSSTKMKDYYV